MIFVCYHGSSARKFSSDPNVNFIDDPLAAAVDFSNAVPGPDGIACVQRQKYVDVVEKNTLKECFVQNVTQCYFTYITEYSDQEQEKCDEYYTKNCKIVFEQRPFNATNRMCKRPLIKKCDVAPSNSFGSPAPDKIVCNTFFETECNTTDVIPDPGDEPLPVTFCQKFPRKICAPDNCKVVEGTETCEESSVTSIVDHPVELCDLQPQKHCKPTKVAIPRLTPEKKCRKIEKEICNSRLVNPHDVEKAVFVKYCARIEKLQKLQVYSRPPPQRKPSYLPPPNPQPEKLRAAAPPPPPPPVPTSGAPSSTVNTYHQPPPQPVYTRQPFNRNKRDPEPSNRDSQLLNDISSSLRAPAGSRAPAGRPSRTPHSVQKRIDEQPAQWTRGKSNENIQRRVDRQLEESREKADNDDYKEWKPIDKGEEDKNRNARSAEDDHIEYEGWVPIA